MTDKFVKMEGICKSFGRVQALRGVDCTVYQNEVLGLLGDNGAGKSTLIKILVGIYPPDKGGIYLNGEKIRFSSNREARASGIETVYQDLALIGLMSISRNFFLGREPTRGIGPLKLLDRRGMAHVCKECLADIGIEIRSPDECVSCLSGGERQSIAIGRAVHFGAKLLILDEPAGGLDPAARRESLGFLARLGPLVDSIRSRGSAALGFCSVAAGRVEAYFQYTLQPWDVAAGSLIVQEAGGITTDLKGQPGALYSPDWLVTNGLVHEAILAVGPWQRSKALE